MGTRFYTLAIAGFWLVAMGWLAVTKIAPLLQSGEPPDYSSLAPRPGEPSQVDCWQLRYKDFPIGWAVSRSDRGQDGRTKFKSLVHLTKLPLDDILNESFGWLRPLLPVGVDGAPLDAPQMSVRTTVEVDAESGLEKFQSTLDISELPALARLEGRVAERKLLLALYMRNGIDRLGKPDETVAYEGSFDLPSREFVTGAFSPQPRLDKLKVGQTWTLRTYRLFPQDSPLQVVQAKVEREDLLVWEGEPMPALLVSYRDEGGTGITAAREPFARLWVKADGVVIQQEVIFANVRITFYRTPTREDDTRVALLDLPTYEPIGPHIFPRRVP